MPIHFDEILLGFICYFQSDVSADEKPNTDRWHGLNHRGKLRARPLARRDSRDEFRIRRRYPSGNVRKSTD